MYVLTSLSDAGFMGIVTFSSSMPSLVNNLIILFLLSFLLLHCLLHCSLPLSFQLWSGFCGWGLPGLFHSCNLFIQTCVQVSGIRSQSFVSSTTAGNHGCFSEKHVLENMFDTFFFENYIKCSFRIILEI